MFADAAIYIQNETYASLPGLFGKAMMDGHVYQARLQFLRENPYLCDDFSNDTTSFVIPRGLDIPTTDGNISLSPDPIILLAARGQCPFQRKASVAERIHPSIEFLVVYNFNSEGEDTLVPMFSEIGDTRLVLLSITHRAGQALKQYLAIQPEIVWERGGPLIHFDSTPPEGLLTVKDLRNMLLSALGLFFMLISLSGCIMIVAGTYGQMAAGNSTTRIVFTNNGTPVVLGAGRNSNMLLTVEQVRHLTAMVKSENSSGDSNHRPGGDQGSKQSDTMLQSEQSCQGEDPGETSCAVCIDDLGSPSDGVSITVLPCQHKFHTDCIVPWLTERQSKCPLCKFDLVEYVHEKEALALANRQEAEAQHGTAAGRPRHLSLLDRFLRYRWTSVLGHDDIAAHAAPTASFIAVPSTAVRRRTDGVMIIAPEEMEVELELTGQATFSPTSQPNTRGRRQGERQHQPEQNQQTRSYERLELANETSAAEPASQPTSRVPLRTSGAAMATRQATTRAQ